MKARILKLFLIVILIALPQIGMTNSYFSAQATIVGNTITTGTWATPSPSPSPSPAVVINEVMWMGSTVSTADEWIELRNTTGSPVDIGQWTIENVTSTGTRTLHIPASRTIPSNGYFLIANYPKTSSNSALNVTVDEVNSSIGLLNSSNGSLILKDEDGNVIDKALGSPAWPQGANGSLKQSMERNDTPGDGLSSASWHTCTDSLCNDTAYWDAEGNNYGTPGSPNLSKNDSTETNLDFYSTPGKHSVGFKLAGEGLPLFSKAEYTIIYDSEQGEQAIKGSVDIDGKSEVKIDGLLVGTCSSGGICVYHSGVTIVNLEVILSGPITRTLTAELNF